MSQKISRTIEKGKHFLRQLRQVPQRLLNCEPPYAYGRRIESMLKEIDRQRGGGC
ncbi:MAG: hypothetical protein M0009_03230 [Deltaproteobacteria bacterium]|nr:hypothetical protein [Deltaproteobacteria bacterium]